MFDFLRRVFCSPQAVIASQPPGDIFPWPADQPLTALDTATIALPAALIEADDTIGDIIRGPDDMPFAAPDGDFIFIRLSAGMTVSLSKPCQAYVVPDGEGDATPRRFQLG
ncbi:hypothetical protein FHS27_006406 [Rhodopirellula rubra]|uniref:Uncharacterized protein n=1 Tax=Aporhodopirellula rubra TaxID=980271 RepID=A0A7W5E6D5_9BACT|nr:hypothetical protein [Aporhodopirellula rubra]MBB3210559.1 hypothetical protein [Aporhodopirellula rubra]